MRADGRCLSVNLSLTLLRILSSEECTLQMTYFRRKKGMLVMRKRSLDRQGLGMFSILVRVRITVFLC